MPCAASAEREHDHGTLSFSGDSVTLQMLDQQTHPRVKVNAHVDTGSMGGFTLPFEMKESLPLRAVSESGASARLVGGNRNLEMAQLDGTISLAHVQFQDPEITFMNPSPGDGNIGSRVLGEFEMTIDQKSKLIAFHSTKAQHLPTGSQPSRRLGLMFMGASGSSLLTVSDVGKGSLAARAGFLPGDTLLRINDKPATDYDTSELRRLFGSSEKLTFDIDRQGETLLIEIP